jgi:hypothetical protein
MSKQPTADNLQLDIAQYGHIATSNKQPVTSNQQPATSNQQQVKKHKEWQKFW